MAKIIKINGVDVKIIEKLSQVDELDNWQGAVKYEAETDWERLRLRDAFNKITNREQVRVFLMRLLVVQNSVVFFIVIVALVLNKLESLQFVFATLIGGTLAETAAMVFFMVKWLFSDIKYPEK